MIGFESGRCVNCKTAIVSAEGTKGYLIEILKHIKECPSLNGQERQDVLELSLALLDLFSSQRKSRF